MNRTQAQRIDFSLLEEGRSYLLKNQQGEGIVKVESAGMPSRKGYFAKVLQGGFNAWGKRIRAGDSLFIHEKSGTFYEPQ